VPHETLSALRDAISAGLVNDAADKYEVSQLGWLFYVNLMYFLMPERGKRWISDNIEIQQRQGRDYEDTRLVQSGDLAHCGNMTPTAVCACKWRAGMPPNFRTIDKLRDWLSIRREQCAKRFAESG
jgi:hypothetical protein